jgi:hypothetical protein
MLLTQTQWNRLLSEISKTCHKGWLVSLDTRHRKVSRHFATDYSQCQGAKDLGSEPVNKYVSVVMFEKLDTISDVPLADIFDVTCLVELANGETLSDTEALGGLGTFAPEVSKPVKAQVREDGIQFRVEGRCEESGYGAKSKRLASIRESRVSS